jgi:hypothetical protein
MDKFLLLLAIALTGCKRSPDACAQYGVNDFEFVTNGTSVTCECLGPDAARCIAFQTDGVCDSERECVMFEDGGFDVQGVPASQDAFDGLQDACSTDTGVGPTEMETWEDDWCGSF